MALALFRWYWTLSSQKLTAISSYRKVDIAMAHASKWVLMLLLLLMPISGIIMSLASGRSIKFFGLFSVPAMEEKNKALAELFHDVHSSAGWAIAVLVSLHVIFALIHHFVKKDITLMRMLGRS